MRRAASAPAESVSCVRSAHFPVNPRPMSQPIVMSVRESTSGAKFIFFREDGRVFGTADEPTPEDLEHARVGLHVIIRLADQQVFERGGEWRPLGRGVVVNADPGSESPPYHVPEAFAP